MSGRRNEPARTRRRRGAKHVLSLTSMPTSEELAEGAAAGPRYTLDNHFVWTVLQRSQMGDGTFPHLFQYYEKPDLHGRDFDKVTYVLYMDKGTVIDRKTSLKETQTAVSGIRVSEEPLREVLPYHCEPDAQQEYHAPGVTPQEYYYPGSKPQEYYEPNTKPQEYYDKPQDQFERQPLDTRRIPTPERRKKKKLISEFYYIKKDRSRSRSAGDKNYGYYDYDWQKPPEQVKSHVSFVEHEVTELEDKAIKEKDKVAESIWSEIDKEKEYAVKSASSAVENKRSKADRWQLRAGADKIESRADRTVVESYGKTSPVIKKNSSKMMDYIKCSLDKSEAPEELLKTPSGTNNYLYVSGKRRLK